jgi:hypothetical protein
MIKPEEMSHEADWPIAPPSEEMPFVEILPAGDEGGNKDDKKSDKNENVIQAKEGSEENLIPPNDFKLAQLTQAEMDALLGGDFETGGNKK